jgi:hypothetical protein
MFQGTAAKVRAAETSMGDMIVEFQVAEMFSGTTLRRTIEVRTPSQGPACGYIFLPGRDYLVFASEVKGAYRTSSCTPTRPVVMAGGWVRLLRAIRDGQPPPALFGFTGTVPRPGWPHASDGSGRMIYPEAVGSVAFEALDGNAKVATVASRADGSFEFGTLPERKYEVRTTVPEPYRIWFSDGTVQSKSIELAPGRSCELDVYLYRKE